MMNAPFRSDSNSKSRQNCINAGIIFIFGADPYFKEKERRREEKKKKKKKAFKKAFEFQFLARPERPLQNLFGVSIKRIAGVSNLSIKL